MESGRAVPRKAYGKIIVLALTALFLVIQLVPYGRDHSNPPGQSEPAWADTATRGTFLRVCGDCHSNRTRWPWYSHVAPVSWLVQSDVHEGREHLNVSEWGRSRNKGEDAAEEVEEGNMPLPIYRLMHPEARITPDQRAIFVRGLAATFGEKKGRSGSEKSTRDDEHDDD